MDNLITMASNCFDVYGGSHIAGIFSEWAAEYDKTIPYGTTPFPGYASKSVAIQKNLAAFEEEQQFFIIKDLCEKKLALDPDDEKATRILTLLIKKFGELYSEDDVDRNIVTETKGKLSKYPQAKNEYDKALELYDRGTYDRNALDSIRLSLELLMKQILNNKKSLENQLIESELLPLLASKGVPKEVTNLVLKIFKGLADYQNNNVKHNPSVTELEVEYIIEQTSILIKLITKALEYPNQHKVKRAAE